MTQRLRAAIDLESAAIAPQTSELIEAAKEAVREIERLIGENKQLTESRDRWEARCLGALWLVPDEVKCGELQEAAHRAKALLSRNEQHEGGAQMYEYEVDWGLPIETHDGRRARVICKDRKVNHAPVVYLAQFHKLRDEEAIGACDLNGYDGSQRVIRNVKP